MKDVIILPTFNERGNIQVIIPNIFNIVPDIWIVVVDDNSPDGTAGAVKTLMEKYPHLSLIKREKKEGLGKAYIAVFDELLKQPDIRSIITMDADLSHNPAYLPLMRKESEKNSVIVGSRYVEGGSTKGWKSWRKLLSLWGNRYSRIITRLPIYDCTGGFNLISADLLRKVRLDMIDSSGYAFLIQLKVMLARAGGAFKEIPIVFEERREGESKISSHIIREGIFAPWRMLFIR